MSDDTIGVLGRQLESAWRLARLHLEGLTNDECFWRPAPVGMHVWPEGEGGWRVDWPNTETYDVGPPSIAWLCWHLGMWWSLVINASFGDGSLTREQVLWPGTVEAATAMIHSLHDEWTASLTDLTADDLRSSSRARWPFEHRPFTDTVAWVNTELTKNAAEIGCVRFLFAGRTGIEVIAENGP